MSLNTHTMAKPSYIYESPDGGDTVYRRQCGSNQRELVTVKNSVHYTYWREMLVAAEHDEYLRDLLNRAESYYRLRYVTEN